MIKVAIEQRFILFCLTILMGTIGVLIYREMPAELLPSSPVQNYGVYFLNSGQSPDGNLQNRIKILEESLIEVSVRSSFAAESDIFSTRFFFSVDQPRHDLMRQIELAVAKNQQKLNEKSPMKVFHLSSESLPSAEVIISKSAHQTESELYEAAKKLALKIEDLKEVSHVEVSGIPTTAVRVRPAPFQSSYSRELAKELEAFASHFTKFAQSSTHSTSQSNRQYGEHFRNYTWKPTSRNDSFQIERNDIDSGTAITLDGKTGTLLQIYKATESNDIAMSKALRSLLKNPEIEFMNPIIVSESAKYIEEAESNVANNLLTGTFLTCICILLFVRKFWATLIVSLSIPVSLLLTIPLLQIAGISRNVMSLAGIALSVGIVVDATLSTVSTFNERLARGFLPRVCAAYAARENEKPLLVTSLSTLAVFLPILFLDGTVGALFKDLSLTVILSQIVGFIVSVYIMPGIACMLHERKQTHLSILRSTDLDSGEKKEHKIISILGRVLGLPFFGAAFNLTLFLIIALNFWHIPSSEFLPIGDSKEFSIQVDLNEPTNPKSRHEIAEKLDKFLMDEGFEKRLSRVGQNQISFSTFHQGNPDIQRISFKLPEITFPFHSGIYRVNPIEPGSRTGQDIEIFLSAVDPAANKKLQTAIQMISGVQEVRLSSDSQALFARQQIYHSNLYASWIPPSKQGEILKFINEKTPLGVVSPASRQLLVSALKPREQYSLLEPNLPLYFDAHEDDIIALTPNTLIPRNLALAEVEIIPKPASVQFTNGQEKIKLSVDVEGRPTGEIENRISRIAKDLSIPFEWHPKSEESRSGFSNLVFCLLSAIVIIAFIIYLQNMSMRLTLVVLCTFLWGPIGSIPGLNLHNESLNASALVGFILLAGTIVNNGILLVDIIEKNRRAQLSPIKSCTEAVKDRAVNVIVTSLTTVLGMLPMVFETGAGSQMYRGLAIVVVYGTLISTPISLVGIPSLVILLGTLREYSERVILRIRVLTSLKIEMHTALHTTEDAAIKKESRENGA